MKDTDWFYTNKEYMGHGNPSGFSIRRRDLKSEKKYNMKWDVEICSVTEEDEAKLIVMAVNASTNYEKAMRILKLCAYKCHYKQVCDHEDITDRCPRCQAKDFINSLNL